MIFEDCYSIDDVIHRKVNQMSICNKITNIIYFYVKSSRQNIYYLMLIVNVWGPIDLLASCNLN